MRQPGRALVVLGVLLLTSGCGLFGSDDDRVPVLDVEVGACFQAPTEVRAEIIDLDDVPCEDAHDQEAYALVDYVAPDGSEPETYPGQDELSRFADGHCLERFSDYVGIDYLDSSLFFTYLLPSVRGWDRGDTTILCLVTSPGEPLTGSVEGLGI